MVLRSSLSEVKDHVREHIRRYTCNRESSSGSVNRDTSLIHSGHREFSGGAVLLESSAGDYNLPVVGLVIEVEGFGSKGSVRSLIDPVTSIVRSAKSLFRGLEESDDFAS